MSTLVDLTAPLPPMPPAAAPVPPGSRVPHKDVEHPLPARLERDVNELINELLARDDGLGGGEWVMWDWWGYRARVTCVVKWGEREARIGI